MEQDLEEIFKSIHGIVIPYNIRRKLNDEQYTQLERMMFGRAGELEIPLSDDPDGRWGDQSEED